MTYSPTISSNDSNAINAILELYKNNNINLENYKDLEILKFNETPIYEDVIWTNEYTIDVPILTSNEIFFKPLSIDMNTITGITSFVFNTPKKYKAFQYRNNESVSNPLILSSSMYEIPNEEEKVATNIINVPFEEINIKECRRYQNELALGYNDEKINARIKESLLYVKQQLSLPKCRIDSNICYVVNNNINMSVQNKLKFDPNILINEKTFKGTIYFYISIFFLLNSRKINPKETYVYLQVKQKNYFSNIPDLIVCDSKLLRIAAVNQ